MTQLSLKDNITQTTLEDALQSEFVEYLNKCRKHVGQLYQNEDDMDSELSLSMHHMLEQFDKYRTNRK